MAIYFKSCLFQDTDSAFNWSDGLIWGAAQKMVRLAAQLCEASRKQLLSLERAECLSEDLLEGIQLAKKLQNRHEVRGKFLRD